MWEIFKILYQKQMKIMSTSKQFVLQVTVNDFKHNRIE